MKSARTLPFLLLIALFAGAPARADFYLHSWEGQHESQKSLRLAPEFFYYVTKSNYDFTNQNVAPATLDSYSRMQTDVLGAYAFNRYVTVYGRFSWARISVTGTGANLSGDIFGPTDQSLGINLRLIGANPQGTRIAPVAIDIQVQADLPAYSNTSAAVNGTPFLGDGSLDLTGGGFLTVPVLQSLKDSWLLSGGIGMTRRSDGFSSALPWSANLRYAPADEGFYFKAGGAGILSSRNDLNGGASASSRPAGTALAAGGSFIVNAINPSQITARAEVGYQMAREMSFGLHFMQTLAGQSSPLGYSIGLGMTAHWDRDRTGKSTGKMSAPEYGRSNQGFVNYSFEARVLKASDRMNLVKIDKGRQDGVEVGQVFDIFLVKQDGSIGEAIARAKCTGVKETEAALTVTEYYKEVWIEEGFVVKRPLD